VRVCLTKLEPRQRGLFAAAWTLGYIATFARTGIEAIAIGAPTGPLGIIYRKAEHKQPWYDQLSGSAVFPVYHVISGLARGAGQKLVDTDSSDATKVQCLAYQGRGGTTLWLANLTAENQSVKLSGAKGAIFGTMLDENSFVAATTDPRSFQNNWKAMKNVLTLKPYAIAVISIND
jgi:hypothetical protein